MNTVHTYIRLSSAPGLAAALILSLGLGNGVRAEPVPSATPVAGAAADSSPTTPSAEPAVLTDGVLGLAPADASFVLYIGPKTAEVMGEALTDPTVAGEGVATLAATLRPVLPSSLMVAVSGPPVLPPAWRVTVAGRTRLGRAELFERIISDVLPAAEAASCGASGARWDFYDDGELGQLIVPGPLPINLSVAVRDGFVLACSDRARALAWQQGADDAARFVDGETFDALTTGYRGRVGVLAWLDLRSLVPMASMPLGQVVPGMYDALQLSAIEYAGLIGPDADARRPMRLVLGGQPAQPGLWHLLASEPSGSALAAVFPADTPIWLHGSMASGSAAVDNLMAFLAAIDPDIRNEYEQERAEWTTDVGVDLQTDILANFGPEWAMGWYWAPLTDDAATRRPPPLLDRGPLLAVRLRDVSLFQDHLKVLTLAFGLESAPQAYRGVTVQRAERDLGPFWYAVVGDVLLVAAQENHVHAAIDAVKDGSSLQARPRYAALRTQLGPASSKLLFADVAGLVQHALPLETASRRVPPIAIEALDYGLAAAVSLRREAYGLSIEVAQTSPEAADTGDMWETVSDRLRQHLREARRAANRQKAVVRAKTLVTACLVYANEHKQWPATLGDLQAVGLVAEETLCSPYATGAAAEPPCPTFFLYFPPPAGLSGNQSSVTVLICEPTVGSDGAAFAFADGHAEWVAPERAKQLLAELGR